MGIDLTLNEALNYLFVFAMGMAVPTWYFLIATTPRLKKGGRRRYEKTYRY